MNRRRWAVVATACALLTFSFAVTSCSGSNQNEIAASVNGDSLSNSELSAMVSSDLFANVLQSPVVNGLADGDATRNVINGWLKLQLLAQSGVFEDVDRNGVAAELEQSNGRDLDRRASRAT